MFDGIYELNTYKPKSTFEITYGEGRKYYYREFYKKNSDKKIDFKNKIEIKGKNVYRNLFFLRIAKINKNKAKEGHIYESSPIAVLCFYENSMNTPSPFVIRRPFYRFDPKKLRLLLLLREDIRNFINHHLINDSLRAFICTL
jgi:hypothetical protein